MNRKEGGANFYLEEVFGRAVDLFEALLARIWHGLHGCNNWAQGHKQKRKGGMGDCFKLQRWLKRGLLYSSVTDSRVYLVERRGNDGSC